MENSIYVFVNESLKMKPGVAAAQIAHAVNMLECKAERIIVLNAADERKIVNIYAACGEKYTADYYVETGTDDIAPFTITAGAVYLPTETGKKLFKSFKLYEERKVMLVFNTRDYPNIWVHYD